MNDLPPQPPPKSKAAAGSDPATALGATGNGTATEIVRRISPPWREATLLDVYAAHALSLMPPQDYPEWEKVAAHAWNVALHMVVLRGEAYEALRKYLRDEEEASTI